MRTWLRRQYVLLELQMGSWEQEGRTITELDHWVRTLDETMDVYENWRETIGDTNDSDSEESDYSHFSATSHDTVLTVVSLGLCRIRSSYNSSSARRWN